MVRTLKKHIAFLLLAVMLTNLCVWDSSQNRIAHQLDHVGLADQNAFNHSHAATPDSGAAAKGNAAHQILHGVDHLQYFPHAQRSYSLPRAALQAHVPAQSDLVPPRQANDPPYRPPSNLLPA